jgi:O-antigen/teichoic acid export membrane protein
MNTRRVSKAGLTLGFGSMAEHALLFARTVLVARLLGPEYFGISVTFLLVVSAFALISDVGIEKYVIQSSEDDFERAMPTLATMLLLRGLVMGLAIVLLSGWIAGRFGQPEHAWFYALAGLIPVIEGFRNLDPLAQQRRMQFGAYVRMMLGGLVPGVVLAVVVAAITRDFIAVAAGCLLTSVVSVTLSHVLAARPYRLGLDGAAFRSVMVYGWPLLLNGVVIFFATQGDRIIIGALEGMSELAGYVSVAAITGGISLFFAKVTGNLFFPLMSEARGNMQHFAQRARHTGAIALLLMSATVFPLALLGAPLVMLLFGPEFRVPALLATFLAIQAAALMLRSWCATISLSLGGTSDILNASLLRIIGLGAAVYALSTGEGIVWVALCMSLGDAAATCFALFQVSRRVREITRTALTLGLALFLLSLLVIGLTFLFDPAEGWILAIMGAVAAALPGSVAALILSDELRAAIRTLPSRIPGLIYRKG